MGGVTLLRVTLCVTWTQLSLSIYIGKSHVCDAATGFIGFSVTSSALMLLGFYFSWSSLRYLTLRACMHAWITADWAYNLYSSAFHGRLLLCTYLVTLISWCSKKLILVARSNTRAEYLRKGARKKSGGVMCFLSKMGRKLKEKTQFVELTKMSMCTCT